MNIVQIINKKSKGLSLSKEEINYFVNGVMDGTIQDYQTSSLLMAIKLKGLTDEETIDYARALVESGDVLPLNEELVDKHSSGGIGDKTTISLLPILGALGLKVFKMSGRGLGFTGGTIDKLESIKGFRTELSIDEVNQMVDEIGISITGQTPKLTPADGKLYALRDVTATVDSFPLIAASIISKKIASGAKNILIDLKVGTGAFVESIEEANELGRLMKVIANSFGRNIFVLFSSMDQPLGWTAGNKIEVIEARDFLKGNNVSNDFSELIKKIATELYSQVKSVSIEEAITKYEEVLSTGKALEKQNEWFTKHGVQDIDEALSYEPSSSLEIKAEEDGFVSFVDTKQFGNALIELKAGRKEKTDVIDFISGLEFKVKTGDEVKTGDTLLVIHSNVEISDKTINIIKENITINDSKKELEIIKGEISW